MDSWTPFLLHFECFQCVLYTFSRVDFHRFLIDFGKDFGLTLVAFLIPFPLAHATCKTFKNHCFYNEFTCFYISEKHDFWWVSWFLFDTCFGIAFWWFVASNSATFWQPFDIKFNVFRNCFFMFFLNAIFMDFESKWHPQVGSGTLLFSLFFNPFPQGVFCKVPWLTLALFWRPFGSMLVVLGILFD